MEVNDASLAADAGAQPVETNVPARDSAFDAVDRAFATLDERDAGGQNADDLGEAAAQPADRTDGRDELGRFKAKDGEPATTEQVTTEKQEPAKTTPDDTVAPSRFSPEAKTAWKDVPAAVKSEILRSHKELEAGIEKYRGKADNFDTLEDFWDAAVSQGRNPREVIETYVGLDRLLQQDLIGGLDRVARNMGYSLQQVVAHMAGQPQQAPTQQDNYIRALETELRSLKDQVSGVSETVQNQQAQHFANYVAEFSKTHPRVTELEQAIVQELSYLGNDISNLELAYQRADRLNPAPAPQPVPPPVTPAPDLTAQTRKGSLSTTGAPASGSNPASRKPAHSPMAAVDRAFADLGIG